MKTDKHYRVTAPHFVVDIVVRDGIIVEAPSFLRWSEKTLFSEFFRHAGTKGWAVETKEPK